MRWLTQHIDTLIALLALIFAGLTYFEIGPGELVAAIGPMAQALAYLIAGGFIGWWACKLRYGYHPRRTTSSQDDGMTFDAFAESFASIPFEMKAFLKTILLYGAAYRRSDDFGNLDQLRYLEQFLITRTIRNNITKYVFNTSAQSLFKMHPELLEEVSATDLAQYRVNGKEGDPCHRFSYYFDWWYYGKSANR